MAGREKIEKNYMELHGRLGRPVEHKNSTLKTRRNEKSEIHTMSDAPKKKRGILTWLYL